MKVKINFQDEIKDMTRHIEMIRASQHEPAESEAEVLKTAHELLAVGKHEDACNLIDAGVEVSLENEWEIHCDIQDSMRFLMFLKSPFNQIKLQRRWLKCDGECVEEFLEYQFDMLEGLTL